MQNLTSDFSDNRKTPRRLKSIVVLGLGALLIAGVIAGGFWLFGGGIIGNGGGEQQAGGSGRLPSEWLVKYFGTDDLENALIGGLSGDPDEDLLYNFQEFMFNTDPTNPDTDGDGQYDGVEVAVNSNPNGEGKLFVDNSAREFTEEFAQTNQLEELTEENITKTVQGLLTNANPDEVEVPLTDIKFLNVTSDNSSTAAIGYVLGVQEISAGLESLPVNLIYNQDQNLNEQDRQIVIGQIYESRDKMQELEVPVPFVTLHQLQLAALTSTAKVLELVSDLDPNLALDEQKDKTHNLSYEMQILQNATQLIQSETIRLSERYPEAFSGLN